MRRLHGVAYVVVYKKFSSSLVIGTIRFMGGKDVFSYLVILFLSQKPQKFNFLFLWFLRVLNFGINFALKPNGYYFFIIIS